MQIINICTHVRQEVMKGQRTGSHKRREFVDGTFRARLQEKEALVDSPCNPSACCRQLHPFGCLSFRGCYVLRLDIDVRGLKTRFGTSKRHKLHPGSGPQVEHFPLRTFDSKSSRFTSNTVTLTAANLPRTHGSRSSRKTNPLSCRSHSCQQR